MAAYAARLEDPALRSQVRGFLTGSIDLVLRLDGPRFAIVDYKTNWLGPAGEPLTLAHYQPEALVAEMSRAHYGLQALLYTVALHRYLRWRLAGYSPGRHLAGVLYLFLRGMAGDADAGVFAWRPPGPLVVALSDVLDRGGRRERGRRSVRSAPGDRRNWGCCVRSTRSGCCRRRTSTSRRGWPGSLVSRASQCELAVALAVRGPRLGHVFVDLATVRDTAAVESDEPVDLSELPWPAVDEWLDALAGSELVAVGEDGEDGVGPGEARPLRLLGTRLYLDRYWREERAVAADLNEMRATRRLEVIAGGPGTGKTTRVARMAAELLEQAAVAGDRPPLIALAAPTGKAAARLEEAVHGETAELPLGEPVRELLMGLRASTLHRLLGWRPGSHSRFAHDRGNRLPHDVVIVDETSMVSLSLMARLVEAVRPEARLILVGDPGQLTSIEAGVVLGDIVGPGEGDGIVVLDRVHRYGGGIASLADAIRAGDSDRAVAALGGAPDEVTWFPVDPFEGEAELALVRQRAVAAGSAVFAAARAGTGEAALEALGRFRLLCAHRRGPYGVSDWASRVVGWLAAELPDLDADQRDYVGRPLLVTENDYELGLYNGDTGVIVQGAGAHPTAVFERGERAAPLQSAAARRRRDRVRDDDSQESGLAVRHRGGAAARPKLTHPHPGASLHGGHTSPPGADPRRDRGRGAARGGATGGASVGAAGETVGCSYAPHASALRPSSRHTSSSPSAWTPPASDRSFDVKAV